MSCDEETAVVGDRKRRTRVFDYRNIRTTNDNTLQGHLRPIDVSDGPRNTDLR